MAMVDLDRDELSWGRATSPRDPSQGDDQRTLSRMLKAYDTDVGDLAPAGDPLRRSEVPKKALRLADYLGATVCAASAGLAWDPPGVPAPTAARCRKRRGRKPCKGVVLTSASEVPDELYWQCDRCASERGVIRGWRGSHLDLSSVQLDSVDPGDDPWVSVELDGAEYRVQDQMFVYDREAEPVLQAARYVDDDESALAAPWRWMDHFVGFVASEANHSRGAKAKVLYPLCDRSRRPYDHEYPLHRRVEDHQVRSLRRL